MTNSYTHNKYYKYISLYYYYWGVCDVIIHRNQFRIRNAASLLVLLGAHKTGFYITLSTRHHTNDNSHQSIQI